MVEALVGLAAVLALVAVAVPWALAPRSASTHPTGSPVATAKTVPTSHLERWQIAFDYPAAWHLMDQSAVAELNGVDYFRYSSYPLGFVGSG